MIKTMRILLLLIALLLGGGLFSVSRVEAEAASEVTPQDLIDLINAMRVARGYPALIVDPILMGTAQQTADTMAIYNLTDHIGNVKERARAAGFGAGDEPWVTENWASGSPDIARELALQDIQMVWADDLHMLPVTNPNYTYVGAGVAEYNGRVIYILHAGYTSNKIYKAGATPLPGQTPGSNTSQIIYPVHTNTPQINGQIIHEVKQGQSMWSIAIAYNTTIKAIAALNGYAEGHTDVYVGQKLAIPNATPSATAAPEGTPLPDQATTAEATPTPARLTRTAAPTRTPSSTAAVIRPTLTATSALADPALPREDLTNIGILALLALCTAVVGYMIVSAVKNKP
ncbi:MAG TPA: LysM peptidoglycan-binding domain-containing protein [Anaerolineaceae bacterium]|nr:LysM peptidoglycan-binding domain-containing protein [Anaerolineaceae bacterium]HPN50989.1 LysM peptidoglycan-binding domain-containing protein [Anaerolineaceae bacterium]